MSHIYGYCERNGGSFWAEPANALSNFAFLLVAFLLLLAWRKKWQAAAIATKKTQPDWSILLLILTCIAIAIGSFLFHTIPNRTTALLDIIPILLFAIGSLGLYARRFLAWKRVKISLLLILYTVFCITMQTISRQYIGFIAVYLCFLITLVGLGWWSWRQGQNQAIQLLLAGSIFAIALFFRQLDYALCPLIKIGTHFLWHIFNSIVIYFIVTMLACAQPVAKQKHTPLQPHAAG